MEDGAEQDKSEAPSHFKLRKAREKGAVARGMDLGFLIGLSAFTGYMWLFAPRLGRQLALSSERALVAAPNVLESRNEILAVTGLVLGGPLRPLIFMMATIFLAVALFELIQTGVVFSTQPLKPDFKRLNPAANFKKLFTFRILIETGKNILKLTIYSAIAFMVIRDALNDLTASITDAGRLAQALAQVGLKLLLFFVLAAMVFAAIDQGIVRRDFMKKMRMSRRELKREIRDREGEPRLKQKRKQLHAEFAKASVSMRGMRGADILITNPTHYAVGLRYDSTTMLAPRVVAVGANQLALRLRRLAFIYGVTIVEAPPLARALFQACRLNSEIPEAHYKDVADLYRSKTRRAGSQRTISVDA
ncbi:hypothetical protein AS593_07460 [Caulobacter vibrioides]|nr:hypothetical protein AS593_07460 [Caulobacter vibrioides]